MNGLKAEFGTQVAWSAWNAKTDGKAFFELLGLRGHPAIVIFNADGYEVRRILGVPNEGDLREIIAVYLG